MRFVAGRWPNWEMMPNFLGIRNKVRETSRSNMTELMLALLAKGPKAGEGGDEERKNQRRARCIVRRGGRVRRGAWQGGGGRVGGAIGVNEKIFTIFETWYAGWKIPTFRKSKTTNRRIVFRGKIIFLCKCTKFVCCSVSVVRMDLGDEIALDCASSNSRKEILFAIEKWELK